MNFLEGSLLIIHEAKNDPAVPLLGIYSDMLAKLSERYPGREWDSLFVYSWCFLPCSRNFHQHNSGLSLLPHSLPRGDGITHLICEFEGETDMWLCLILLFPIFWMLPAYREHAFHPSIPWCGFEGCTCTHLCVCRDNSFWMGKSSSSGCIVIQPCKTERALLQTVLSHIVWYQLYRDESILASVHLSLSCLPFTWLRTSVGQRV